MEDLEKPPVVAKPRPERGASRRRVYLGGKVIYGKGMFSPDCTVRDLSPTGARISLGKRQSIPDNVFFLDLKSGRIYEATVAWRRTPNFGLKFAREVDSAQLPPDLKKLEKFLLASRQQTDLG